MPSPCSTLMPLSTQIVTTPDRIFAIVSREARNSCAPGGSGRDREASSAQRSLKVRLSRAPRALPAQVVSSFAENEGLLALPASKAARYTRKAGVSCDFE